MSHYQASWSLELMVWHKGEHICFWFNMTPSVMCMCRNSGPPCVIRVTFQGCFNWLCVWTLSYVITCICSQYKLYIFVCSFFNCAKMCKKCNVHLCFIAEKNCFFKSDTEKSVRDIRQHTRGHKYVSLSKI